MQNHRRRKMVLCRGALACMAQCHLGGSGGMLPRKNFKNWHALRYIVVHLGANLTG